MLNNSYGGKNPQGWLCSHNSFFMHYDNGGEGYNASTSGCGSAASFATLGEDTYGYDQASWFANQRDDLQALILAYSYNKTKCLPYGHLSMPGRMNTSPPSGDPAYNAILTPAVKHAIYELWNTDVYACPTNWSFHNFSLENVANDDNIAGSSLVLVGDTMKFFIGTDGYIHGFVYNNGTYNGGNWLTVSPSYSASVFYGTGEPAQLITNQVKAQSDLIASPDGSTLLYIGVDGYIHGFTIVNIWMYEYFTFMQYDMADQHITALSSLIWPLNEAIYYIGTYEGEGVSGNDGYRVHGFQASSGFWATVSPTYSAEGNGQSLSHQVKAASLTYSYDLGCIFYVGINGLLYVYEMLSSDLINYAYRAWHGNGHLIDQHLTITGNLAIYGSPDDLRIYFVGHYNYGGENLYYIHCLIYNYSADTFYTVSPTYSAAMYNGQPLDTQYQSDPIGNIAVSPDGNTIVYFSVTGGYICWFHNIDGVNYAFNAIEKQLDVNDAEINKYPDASSRVVTTGNSLQFVSDDEFFYIARCTISLQIVADYTVASVCHCILQESYCTADTDIYCE